MKPYIVQVEERGPPKHAEQPRQLQQPQQRLSAEEIGLMRDYALLPVMLSVVDKNRTEIEMSDYSLKPLYIAASDVLMKRMTTDLYAVKKALRQRGIQVIEDGKADNAVQYRFTYRGYESTFQLLRDIVRAEISMRLSRYICGLFNMQETK